MPRTAKHKAPETVTSVDAVTGQKTTYILGADESASVFKLAGHGKLFHNAGIRTILGRVKVIDGVSLDGKYRTTARCCDVITTEYVA